MQESHLVQQNMPLCWDHICFMFTLNLEKEMWSQGICLAIRDLLLISSNAPLKANIQCKIAGFYGWGKGNKYDIFWEILYECVFHRCCISHQEALPFKRRGCIRCQLYFLYLPLQRRLSLTLSKNFPIFSLETLVLVYVIHDPVFFKGLTCSPLWLSFYSQAPAICSRRDSYSSWFLAETAFVCS